MKAEETGLPINAVENKQNLCELDALDSFTERWRTRIRQAASKILRDPFYSKAESVKRGSALGGRKEMKDEETGLEIYGIPNAETLAAMKEADEISRKHHTRFSSAEELFARLEELPVIRDEETGLLYVEMTSTESGPEGVSGVISVGRRCDSTGAWLSCA